VAVLRLRVGGAFSPTRLVGTQNELERLAFNSAVIEDMPSRADWQPGSPHSSSARRKSTVSLPPTDRVNGATAHLFLVEIQ